MESSNLRFSVNQPRYFREDRLASRRLFELVSFPSQTNSPSHRASILDELAFGHIADHSRIVTQRECRPKRNNPGLISPVAEDKFVRPAQTTENQTSEKHEISEGEVVYISPAGQSEKHVDENVQPVFEYNPLPGSSIRHLVTIFLLNNIKEYPRS
jgi:hypothetical protein